MPALTDIQEQMRDSAGRFLRDAGPAGTSGRDKWAAIADMGWLGAILTEAQGGFGGPTEAVLLTREIGRTEVALPYLGAGVLPLAFIGRAGLPGVGDTTIDQIISGERMIAGAWPDSGCDPGGIELHRTAGVATLRGTLDHIWDAQDADILLFAARDAGSGTTAIVAVDATQARAAGATLATIDGRSVLNIDFSARAVTPIEVFDNAEAIDAWHLAMQLTLLAQCAEMVGGMSAMFAMTREYLAVRKQFGQPLAGFQALRHRLADMFAELDQAEAMLGAGLAAIDLDDAKARARIVAACRLRVGLAARFVGAQAVQLHGGIALTEEYALGRFYRRGLVLRKMWGDEVFHAGLMGQTCEAGRTAGAA